MESFYDVERLPEFPDYGVTPDGRVISFRRDPRPLREHRNQRGHLYVIFPITKLRNGNVRQLSKLVANAYKPSPFEHWDTIIYLDYNKNNCCAENLEWRPRWFAVKYNRQGHRSHVPPVPIFDIDTGQTFSSIQEAAMTFGMLEEEIFEKLGTGEPVFPLDMVFDFL